MNLYVGWFCFYDTQNILQKFAWTKVQNKFLYKMKITLNKLYIK